MTAPFADHPPDLPSGGTQKTCALLWDESLLWGIMAWRALQEAGLPFDLLRADEVRRGALNPYRLLFVPGGWASNKLAALGEKGDEAIRRFVSAGGSYLGICGGAGLATTEGIGLLPVGRKPSAQRVASFSGGIGVSLTAHPIWHGIKEPIFSAWWPSQLDVTDPAARVLATYAESQPDAFSSDIPVESGNRQGWPALEARYGILLDPARLRGEPAILEGRCGRGRVVLSMLHFDTPGDRNGRAVLRTLWRYLAGDSPIPPEGGDRKPPQNFRTVRPAILANMDQIRAAVAQLIGAGEGLGIWRWRNPYLLQWHRGVRGLEYSTLAVLVREIQNRLTSGQEVPGGTTTASVAADSDRLQRELSKIQKQLAPFVAKAMDLLERERLLLQGRPLSPLSCDDEAIQVMRHELFGSAMSHGGTYKHLIDALDRLWLILIRGGGSP